MRTPLRTGLLATLMAAILAACGGDGPPGGGDAAGIGSDSLPPSVPAPRMEGGLLIVAPEQVWEWQAEGREFVLMDARDTVQYAREHLPGAINVPYVEIRAGGRLPTRDQRIVVYCSSETCPISQYAYEALARLGYREVYDMREGLEGWKEAGYPTVQEGDPPPESR